MKSVTKVDDKTGDETGGELGDETDDKIGDEIGDKPENPATKSTIKQTKINDLMIKYRNENLK